MSLAWRCAAAAGLLIVAGCQSPRGPGGLGTGYAQRNDYVCAPPQQARRLTFYPGPGPGFTAWFEPRSAVVALKFKDTPVRHLSRVPGGAGVLYADDAFAWNDNGTRGILTSTKNALVYYCRRLA